MEVVIVEVLDRAGRVRTRATLGNFPALIGRGYDCDVILDDGFVSPHHLRIDIDADGLVAVDLATTNGTTNVATNAHVQRWPVVDDGHLRIGATTLRFRSREHQVVAAKPLSTRRATEVVASQPPLAFAAALVVAAYVGLFAYLDTHEEPERLTYVWPFMVAGAFIVAWGGTWALLTRVLRSRFSFGEHCLVAGFGFVLFGIATTIEEYIAFSFAAPTAAAVTSLALGVFIGAALLYLHERIASIGSPRRIAVSSLCASLAVHGLVAMLYLDEDLGVLSSWSNMELYHLKLPATRVVDAVGTDEFLEQMVNSKASIDAALDDG